MNALGLRTDKKALEAIKKYLKNKCWQIRFVLIKALGDSGNLKVVKPLIETLGREKGRLREDINEALKKLTSISFHGSYDIAKAWLKRNAKLLEKGKLPKPGDKKKGGDAVTVTFFGIKTLSKRVVFVIDVSGSMAWFVDLDKNKKVETGKKKKDDELKGRMPKIKVAKYELKKTVKSLSPKARFNVIFYSSWIREWKEKLVLATKKTKEIFYEDLAKTSPGGATNIYGALERAFKYTKPPQADKAYSSGGVDTIFFLTDGQSTSGKILNPFKILEKVQEWNRFKKVKIHCIAIGLDDKVGFLRRLAKQNNGTFEERN